MLLFSFLIIHAFNFFFFFPKFQGRLFVMLLFSCLIIHAFNFFLKKT